MENTLWCLVGGKRNEACSNSPNIYARQMGKGEKMIEALPEKECANEGCTHKLHSENKGNNIGGWKAARTKNGDWKTGYVCRQCSNQSTQGTQKLLMFQQTNYFHSVTNNEIENKRQWQGLIKTLKKEKESDAKTLNNSKMPNWDDVLGKIETKRKKEAKVK